MTLTNDKYLEPQHNSVESIFQTLYSLTWYHSPLFFLFLKTLTFESLFSMAEKSASSASSSTTSTVASSSSATMQSKSASLMSGLNQSGLIKLDRSNYRLWHSVVLSSLRGHRVEGFVLGTKICPPEFITDELGIRIHPEFDEWLATDSIIF